MHNNRSTAVVILDVAPDITWYRHWYVFLNLNATWVCDWLDPKNSSRAIYSVPALLLKDHDAMWARTVIVYCPLHPATLTMNLTAFNGSKAELTYQNVRVCDEQLYTRPVETVLCSQTMVNTVSLKLAHSWAHYHIRHVGFDLIMLYVEHPDMKLIAENLKELIDEGRLTLISGFVKGLSGGGWSPTVRPVSEHYVFRAKGNAKWVANNDIDEYFDFTGFSNISQVLESIDRSHPTSVVNVMRQYWRVLPDYNVTLEDFPCMATCVQSKGYETTCKPIFKAMDINYHFIHFATTKKMYFARPGIDRLRVNHLQFRNLHQNRHICSEEFSWADGWGSGSYADYLRNICPPRHAPQKLTR